MAEGLVLETERDGLVDEAGLVRHLLDLLRADPIPRRLDHVVTTSDKEQEALLVADDDIAGPDRQLRSAQPDRTVRRRPEPRGRAFSVVPVAQRDERTPVHQLPRLSRATEAAVLPDHEDLGVRDGLADGVRPAVHLAGIEVGGAECPR